MKTFQPLPEIPQKETVDLSTMKDLTFDQAKEYVGCPTTDGRKIIGVTGKPGQNQREGVFFTIKEDNKKSSHHQVG